MKVFENKKATMKLLTECVKLKKLMAANTNKLPINIESFIDDFPNELAKGLLMFDFQRFLVLSIIF